MIDREEHQLAIGAIVGSLRRESHNRAESAVEAVDGLIIFTPEYNRSIPAVTKKAVDWLSRRPGESVLSRSTVGIVAATPSRHDATGVRSHLSESVGGMAARLFEPTLGLSSISRKIEQSVLGDESTADVLSAWLNDFVTFVREAKL